jgi:predicted Zn-ribbon and HTH transcriptional regulator
MAVSRESQDVEVTMFEASCAACGHCFDEPRFADYSSGLLMFCAENGAFYAYFDCTSAVAALVTVVLPKNVSTDVYQTVLARLADLKFGQKFTTKTRCPKCLSGKLATWEGRKKGTVHLSPTTYTTLLSAPRDELIEKIQDAARIAQNALRTWT